MSISAIEYNPVISGVVVKYSQRGSKMNEMLRPHSGLLLKAGIDREVKAGEKFKHCLAHSHIGSLQLIPDW